MTTPDEAIQTQERVERFLVKLATGRIKGVPKEVRETARRLLRHLATPGDVERGVTQ